jgi:capsular exopolysaccharide synthesis family protein
MSYIFDALQRSETERSGIELDAFDLPTELLQIAESAVTAPVRESEPAIQAPEPGTSRPDATDMAQSVTNPPSLYPEFESLPVSLLSCCKLVSVTDKESLAAEKFRFLAVRLRQLQQRRPLKRLLITSTVPEEGKSTVAANVACALAGRRQQKVLLVEGDLRRPMLRRQFGLGKLPGLADYLQGTSEAIPVYRLDALGIWILQAGGAPQHALELMQAGRLSPLMDQLNAWFDWIVIDSPPILPLADTSIWARLVDGILLVTRPGTTDEEQLRRGLEAIEQSKLLGAVLNSSINTTHSYYYHRYGPGEVSQENANKK